MSLKIRKARISDCKSVSVLANVPELAGPNGYVASPKWIEAYLNERQIVIVAEIDKKIVGFVAGESIVGNGALIQLIAVDRKCRNQGIGKSLLDAFEKECRKRKVIWVLAYGNAESKGILALLKSKGYLAGTKEIELVKLLGKPKI